MKQGNDLLTNNNDHCISLLWAPDLVNWLNKGLGWIIFIDVIIDMLHSEEYINQDIINIDT